MSGMVMFFFSSTLVVCLYTASATSCSDTLRAGGRAGVCEIHASAAGERGPRNDESAPPARGEGSATNPRARCVPAKDALVLPNLHLDGELADSGERGGQRLGLVKHLAPSHVSRATPRAEQSTGARTLRAAASSASRFALIAARMDSSASLAKPSGSR